MTKQWDGFYEGLTCGQCGKPLEGQGSGHPAESYAGTYNGLCYPCTNGAAYPLNDYQFLSGARYWSHPPHCPSWRRDRETFLAFDDCDQCQHGRIMISRSFGQGGPYPKQCEKCQTRNDSDPRVAAGQAYHDKLSELRRAWYKKANKEFQRRVKAAGITDRKDAAIVSETVLREMPRPDAW